MTALPWQWGWRPVPSSADQEEVDPAAQPEPPAARGKEASPLGRTSEEGALAGGGEPARHFPWHRRQWGLAARWEEGATKTTAAVE